MSRRLVIAALLAYASCSGGEPPAVGDACRQISGCAATEGLACLAGTCQLIACEGGDQCPVDAACVRGRCSAPECASDEACERGAVCARGVCRSDRCASRDDCIAGLVCRGAPAVCEAPTGRCESDEECARGSACKIESARCAPACDEERACSGGAWCDEGVCRDRCAGGSGCDRGESCAAGLCRAASSLCQEESPCPATRPLRDPLSCACVECTSDGECEGAGQVCDAGACVVCAVRAESDRVCASLGLMRRERCCVTCLSGEECADGFACVRGRCAGPPGALCADDADCSRDGICELGVCARPASRSACSEQGDCDPAEACGPDRICRAQGSGCRACPHPSRCYEPAGGAPACVGCPTDCASEGCPEGEVCARDEGSIGRCVGPSVGALRCKGG